MQFKTLVVLSLSAAAMAAPEKRQAPTNSMDLVSLYQVLQTALPQSLIAEALTNSAAVSSEIASDFEHSMTPSWFSNLPTSIQTYLVPVVTNPAALSSAIGAAGSNNTAAVTSIIAGANSTAAAGVAGNGTAMPTGAGVANTTAIGHNSTGVAAAQSSIQSSIHNQNSSAMASATGSGTVITGAGSSSSATGASGSSSSGSSSGSSGSSSGSSTSSSSAGASMPTAIYGMGLAGMVGLVGVFAL